MFRSLWLRVAGALAFLFEIGWILLYVPAVQDWLLVQGIPREVSRESAFAAAPKELKVLLCGTSASPPNLLRAKTCTVVMAGQHTAVVDVGPGVALAVFPIISTELHGVIGWGRGGPSRYRSSQSRTGLLLP